MRGSPRSRLLRPYLRREWKALASAAGGSIAIAIAELARPFPLKLVIDRIASVHGKGPFQLTAADVRLALFVGVLAVVVASVDAVADYMVDIRLEKAGTRIVHELRCAAYDRLQQLSLAYHQTRPTGDLVTRVTGDVNAVGDMFTDSLGTVASSALLLVGMLIVSIAIDPMLALVAFSVTPLLGVVTVRARRHLKAAARKQRASEGQVAAMATEALGAMREVKALGTEQFEVDRLTSQSAEAREAGLTASTVEARFGALVDVTGAIGTALVLVFGVYRLAAGAITPGDLVVLTSYVRRVYRPLRDLSRQATRIARSLARAERVAEVLEADEILRQRRHAFHGARGPGEIRFDDVQFAYGNRPVLDHVSFTVRPGERAAVIGQSGAGKTTIASLLVRLADPTGGRVLLDGHDLRDCRLDWVRKEIGLVLQDTVLFEGTVLENLRYGTDAGQAAVERAAKAAGIHDVVTALPEGYATELGPRGVGLSGGQRQRVGVARTLLRDPAVLVLDEPTTGLDVATEAEVLAGLDQLMIGRTTIIITHSMALASRADRVFVVDAGKVVQQGRPDDLLDKEGPFRRALEAGRP